jgi:hypothetical protein
MIILTNKNDKCVRLDHLQSTKKYVFHGSSIADLKIIKLSPATDKYRQNEFNNDAAVFASLQVAPSILFACLKGRKMPTDGTWGVGCESGEIVARIPSAWKKEAVKTSGYVYVLPAGDFVAEPNGWQVKSKNDQIPVDSVKVRFTYYEKLGGRIEWVADVV